MRRFLPDRIEVLCQEGYQSNDGIEQVEKQLVRYARPILNRVQSLVSELHGPPLSPEEALTGEVGASLQENWGEIVHGYSGRNMSSSHHMLPALAAVASIFAARTGDRYVAGL